MRVGHVRGVYVASEEPDKLRAGYTRPAPIAVSKVDFKARDDGITEAYDLYAAGEP
ncbi:MAG TPA: hypothetical protein VEY33_01630 [Gemmatimonadota bacterium]|nr:hypothetical protein [Gemmatimonadota bacterium]